MMNLKFDRNELSGAFGDIGTDLPLLVGFIAIGLNYGYLIGLILGTILHYALIVRINKT